MSELVESNPPSPRKVIFAYFALILTTILWGSTFIITKNVISEIPLFFYLGLRFLLALIIFLPFCYRYKKFDKKTLIYGFLAGIIYAFSIIVQTIGLESTTAGKGGFITGLSTLIVPFLAWALYKKTPKKRVWIAVILSVIGMALLLLDEANGFVIGDLYVLICAFGFAVYIILVDRHVKEVDLYLYLMVQIIIITLSCFICSFILKEQSYSSLTLGLEFWLIMLYMGCIASGITFITQNWGQKRVGPAQTAIIFTLEPVFALIFASFIIGDETLTLQMIVGCSFIFIAILLTVIKNKKELD